MPMNSLITLGQQSRFNGQVSIVIGALDGPFNVTAPISAKLCTQDLLSKLFLSYLKRYQPQSVTKTQKVGKELDRLLERLRGRTNLSESVTINSILKLSSEAQDILGSMLALETRHQFDNFAQIDFKRSYDHEALIVATKRARDWVSNDQGRPQNDHLDQFFDGVTDLFKQHDHARHDKSC